VAEPGRAGLHEALLSLTEEPTLLMHDDLVITAKGAAAMERSLHCGNRYVVPYSNDRDLGSYFQSLPVDHGAEKKLDRINAPRETKELVATRSTCLLASKSDLIGLLAEPIADPFSTIVTHDHNFFAAAGAIAAHVGNCVQRTTPVDPEGRPLLVAALIVKDEEEMLPGCLESIQGLVDRIEICDTGSSDNTVAIAKAAGANVIHREWRDDFAVARNYVLEQCRDARYILYVDADERIECANPEQLRRYLATYSAEHPALTIDVANIDKNGLERNRFRSVRVFHADQMEFRGAIHEVVYAVGDPDPISGSFLNQLVVRHHGYTDEIVAAKGKVQRNLALAEAAYAQDPGPLTAVHLARSLGYAGQHSARALTLLEEAWESSAEASPTARAQILTLLADQCVALGNDQRAFELSKTALELVPADDTAGALLATTAERLNRLPELIEVAERVAGMPSPNPAHFVPENRCIFRNGLARAYALAGEAEKAVATTFELLSEAPAAFGSWHSLVACLNAFYGRNALEKLLPLALKDSSGGFIEPVIKTYPTADVVQICVAYGSEGGEVPEVIRVGLLAAAMANDDDSFAALLPHSSKLPLEVRIGLAGRVAGTGRTDLADQLRAAPERVAV
jgi:tetratricopeptide (TPR) repeat protein